MNLDNQTSQKSTTVNQSVSGISYTDPDKIFNLSFPSGWTLISIDGGKGKLQKSYNFSGPEGTLSVSYASSYGGGGCPHEYVTTLKLKSKSITDACVQPTEIGLASVVDKDLQGVIFFDATYKEQNKQKILNVLSTFSIIGSPTYDSNGLLDK